MDSNPFDALDDADQDVLRPGPAPGLSDRFWLNFEAGQRYNTVLGAIHDAESEANRSDRARFDAKFETFPAWQGFLEGSTALAGQLIGTAASPENFVPLGIGEKILVGSKMAVTGLWAKVFAGAVDGAAANAVADAAIQGVEIAGSNRESFDPAQYAAGILLGGIAGAGGGAIARGAEKLRKANAAPTANPFDALDDAPLPAPPAAPLPEKPDMAGAGEPPPTAVRETPPLPDNPEVAPPSTIGEKLSERAATARQLTDQEKRILRTQAPVGKTPKKPASLSRFLAGEGGIADYKGELKSLGLDQVSIAGAGRLVKDSGRSLDYAREAAAEAGYFDHLYGDRDTAVAQSTVDDLLSALDRDVRGDRVFSSEDAGMVEAAQAHEGAKTARERLRGNLDQLSPHFPDELPDAIVIRAAEHVDQGRSPADAIEAAIMEHQDVGEARVMPEGAVAEEIPFYEAARSSGGRSSAKQGAIKPSPVDEFLQMAQYAAPSNARSRPAAGLAGKAVAAIGRVRETAEGLAQALGVAATRQQRIAAKQSVRGIYKTKSGVVRVRNLEDFDVLTHEYGHHVEKRVPGMTKLMKQHRKVLGFLDYDPKRGDAQEGFAEFFRLWITNRAYARNALPRFSTFVADFEAELAKHPEIRATVDDAEKAWSAFLSAPSTAAVASTIVSSKRKGWLAGASAELKKEGVAGTIHDVLQRVYGFLFDDLNPLARAVKELQEVHFANTGKKLDLPVTGDAYKLARMSRGAYAAGHMDVMYGVAPYRGLHPESPSLRDAIVEATGKPNALSGWDEGKVREFGAYLWSRRALGEWERFDRGEIPNPPDKLTRGDHHQNVVELEAANPQFALAADKAHRFGLALWKKKFDAGLIDQETYEGGLKIVDYVPGLRDWSTSDTDMKVPGGRSKGKTAKGGFAKRFRGSKRDVINPLESMAADAYETAMAIARNDVVKALDRLALQAGPGAGAIAERIPAKEMRATMVDPLEAVETAARNAGLAKPDIVMLRDAVESAIGDEKAAIFRPAIINDKGEPIVFFRDGGELTALRLADGRFGRDMYGVLSAMSQHEKNFWLELVSMPARLMRAGIVTSLDFIFANFIRDQVMAGILYGSPLRRIGASLQGAADDVLGRETARSYSRVHGLSGGEAVHSLGDVMVKRDLAALARKGWLTSKLTSWRGLMSIPETSETASRLGLFRTFMKEAQGRGLDDMEAALEASWRARDYLDFDRRGSGMAALARIVPFLNVSLQGLDKVSRHMIAPWAKKALGIALTPEEQRALGQAGKSWAYLAALTAGSIGLYALQSRNEDHDEISNYTRSTGWMIKWGEKWIAVPKPFELAMPINLAEAAFDAWKKKDPTAGGRWLDSLFYTLMPPNVMEGNPALTSYFEVKTNTNLFTGAPIVPENLQGLEPFLQYTATTSAISRMIGNAFNISPAIADHLITAHLGSWGRNILSLYDLAQPDAPGFAWDDAPISRRFIKDAAKGAQSTTMFWQTAGEREGTLEGKARSWRTMMDTGDAAGAADYYSHQDDIAKAYIAISAMDAKARRLHPLIRARGAIEAIGAIRRDMAMNRLTDALGTPIVVPSAARTAADDILSTLAMAMARNALALTGVPGWSQRGEIQEDGFYRELAAVSPEVAQRLADGFATKKVWSYEAIKEAWPDLRNRVLEEGSAAPVLDLVGQVEVAGTPIEGGLKIRRKKKPALTLN